MESKRLEYIFPNAVIDLRNAGFQVEATAYGFSATLQDLDANYQLGCGYEHGGNISLSVASGTSVVMWFFRQTIQEMVEFLLIAVELMKSGQIHSWLVALDHVDKQ